MKNLILKFISWVGIDKFAHLGLAGFVCACAGLFGWILALIAFVIVSVAGVIKELEVDGNPDWWDYLAGEVGASIALALSIVAALCL